MPPDPVTASAAHSALVVDGGPTALWGHEPHIQDGTCQCLCDRCCHPTEDICICPDCTDCPDHRKARDAT